MSNDIDDFIEHYGVKGMQWGVRRSSKQLARARKAKKENQPAAKAKRMSDSELKSKVERLRLEREYVKITNELAPSPVVKSLLAKHGGQAVSIAVGSTTSAIVGAYITSKFKKDK